MRRFYGQICNQPEKISEMTNRTQNKKRSHFDQCNQRAVHLIATTKRILALCINLMEKTQNVNCRSLSPRHVTLVRDFIRNENRLLRDWRITRFYFPLTARILDLRSQRLPFLPFQNSRGSRVSSANHATSQRWSHCILRRRKNGENIHDASFDR